MPNPLLASARPPAALLSTTPAGHSCWHGGKPSPSAVRLQPPLSPAVPLLARQGNPDMSSRELALKVRELRSKSGAASKFGGKAAGAPTRPTGPNRHGAKQAAAADAHWKVGASETLSGQTATGTHANRSPKTTGNEASTCRSITGTEYLGAEVFQAFCQGQPAAQQPAKVRVTSTSRGNAVTGNEVGRSEKVTGDEPGTCKAVTGTEYIGADQASAYCGGVTPLWPRLAAGSPRAVKPSPA